MVINPYEGQVCCRGSCRATPSQRFLLSSSLGGVLRDVATIREILRQLSPDLDQDLTDLALVSAQDKVVLCQ